MHAGQVPVEDEHVVGVHVEFEEGVRAIVGDVGGYALVAQALSDVVGEPLDVLGDQDPYPGTPAAAGWAGAPARTVAAAQGRSMTARRPPAGRAFRCRFPP